MAVSEGVLARCPHCKRGLPDAAEHAGKVLTCPACRRRFRFPFWSGETGSTDAAGNLVRVDGPMESNEAGDGPIDFVEMDDEPAETLSAEEIPDPDSADVVRAVQSILGEALQLSATRILIIPVRDEMKVVYRIQDAIISREDPPPEMLYPVLVQLLTMANLSGHIKLFVGNRQQRLHVTFKPTRFGLCAVVDIDRGEATQEVHKARAARMGYRYVDLGRVDIPADVLKTVPEDLARENSVLPVQLDGDELMLVSAEPAAPETVDRLRFALNRPVSMAMAPLGAILSAIDRYYGPSDAELADLMLWELAQPSSAVDSEPDPALFALAEADDSAEDALARDDPAVVVAAHLRAGLSNRILDQFQQLSLAAPLCRQMPDTGDLEIEFPHARHTVLLPSVARRYVHQKVWGLREAILMRLERFLERDDLARRLAMAFSQYQTACQLRLRRRCSLNAATTRDAWVNFLYALIQRDFPEIDSNGAMLTFVTEQTARLSTAVASMVDGPDGSPESPDVRAWLERLEQQTTLDEPLDFDSPPIMHRVDLLLAEAAYLGASHLIFVPREDHVEVACRIHSIVYRREDLPLRLHYLVASRLLLMADASGKLETVFGPSGPRATFRPRTAQHGLAAMVELTEDPKARARAESTAQAEGSRCVSLQDVKIPPRLLRLLPKAIAWQKRVLPLSVEEGAITVVLTEPPSSRRRDELRLLFNTHVDWVLATETDLIAAIFRHYHPVEQERSASSEVVELLR